MIILSDIYKEIPSYSGCVLTIGNFDGVHRGHQEIISLTRQKAQQENLPSAIMSFTPHPRDFFVPSASERRLTTASEKREIFESLGISYYFELPFDTNLASMAATTFIEHILVKWAKAQHIIVGENFYFGKQKQGNIVLLKEYANKGYFSLTIPTYTKDENGTIISSSYIRQLLAEHKIEQAESLLGRPLKKPR